MPKKVYDDAKLKAEALELRKQGLSYREIAKRLGCSVYKVHELISEYESPRSRLRQAAELAEKLEEIASRVEALSAKVSRLEASLSNVKPLEDITEKLSKLWEKVDWPFDRYSEIWNMSLSRAEYYMERCRYFDGTYCNRWYWKSRPSDLIEKYKLKAKEVGGKWYLQATPEFCLGCKGFKER